MLYTHIFIGLVHRYGNSQCARPINTPTYTYNINRYILSLFVIHNFVFCMTKSSDFDVFSAFT